MPQISVVIITLNEEKNIARCLDSIKEIADEIVVVDSFSTDRTEEICKAYQVKFIQIIWEGYSVSKNYGNSIASHNCILSLDADEALSNELKFSIIQLKKRDDILLCSFNRLTNYCGKWIKYCGWYPDKKIRIFDKTLNQWEGSIHEHLNVKPYQKISHLNGDLLHYSYYTIKDHIAQTEKFTSLSALELFNKGKTTNLLQIYLRPVVKFINNYFIKLGILDGYYGFIICRISAYATYLKYRKLLNHYKQ